jgi:hypothetical protein
MKPKYYTTSFTCIEVQALSCEKILKLQKIMPPNTDIIKNHPCSMHIKLRRNFTNRHINFCQISDIYQTDICYPHLVINTTNRPSICSVNTRMMDHETLTIISNLQNRWLKPLSSQIWLFSPPFGNFIILYMYTACIAYIIHGHRQPSFST